MTDNNLALLLATTSAETVVNNGTPCITIETFYPMLNRDTKVEIQQDLLNHRPLDCVKSFAKVKLEENAWYM